MPDVQDLTLDITQRIEIQAAPDDAFKNLLHRLSDGNATPDNQAMPMVLEAWPGGRWFRDLGDGMHEARVRGGQLARVKFAHNGELLQQHRSLAPESAFVNIETTILHCRRIVVGRPPTDEIVGAQHAFVFAPARVQ